MTYLIWSHEHSAWWAPGGSGYNRDVRRAGRYSRETALIICRQALPGSRGSVPNEIPVLEQDLIDAAILPANGESYNCPECKLVIRARQDHKVGCRMSGGAGAANG